MHDPLPKVVSVNHRALLSLSACHLWLNNLPSQLVITGIVYKNEE